MRVLEVNIDEIILSEAKLCRIGLQGQIFSEYSNLPSTRPHLHIQNTNIPVPFCIVQDGKDVLIVSLIIIEDNKEVVVGSKLVNIVAKKDKKTVVIKFLPLTDDRPVTSASEITNHVSSEDDEENSQHRTPDARVILKSPRASKVGNAIATPCNIEATITISFKFGYQSLIDTLDRHFGGGYGWNVGAAFLKTIENSQFQDDTNEEISDDTLRIRICDDAKESLLASCDIRHNSSSYFIPTYDDITNRSKVTMEVGDVNRYSSVHIRYPMTVKPAIYFVPVSVSESILLSFASNSNSERLTAIVHDIELINKQIDMKSLTFSFDGKTDNDGTDSYSIYKYCVFVDDKSINASVLDGIITNPSSSIGDANSDRPSSGSYLFIDRVTATTAATPLPSMSKIASLQASSCGLLTIDSSSIHSIIKLHAHLARIQVTKSGFTDSKSIVQTESLALGVIEEVAREVNEDTGLVFIQFEGKFEAMKDKEPDEEEEEENAFLEPIPPIIIRMTVSLVMSSYSSSALSQAKKKNVNIHNVISADLIEFPSDILMKDHEKFHFSFETFDTGVSEEDQIDDDEGSIVKDIKNALKDVPPPLARKNSSSRGFETLPGNSKFVKIEHNIMDEMTSTKSYFESTTKAQIELDETFKNKIVHMNMHSDKLAKDVKDRDELLIELKSKYDSQVSDNEILKKRVSELETIVEEHNKTKLEANNVIEEALKVPTNTFQHLNRQALHEIISELIKRYQLLKDNIIILEKQIEEGNVIQGDLTRNHQEVSKKCLELEELIKNIQENYNKKCLELDEMSQKAIQEKQAYEEELSQLKSEKSILKQSSIPNTPKPLPPSIPTNVSSDIDDVLKKYKEKLREYSTTIHYMEAEVNVKDVQIHGLEDQLENTIRESSNEISRLWIKIMEYMPRSQLEFLSQQMNDEKAITTTTTTTNNNNNPFNARPNSIPHVNLGSVDDISTITTQDTKDFPSGNAVNAVNLLRGKTPSTSTITLQ